MELGEITLLAVPRIIYRVARGTMVWLGMTSYNNILLFSLYLSLITNIDEEFILSLPPLMANIDSLSLL